MEQRAEADEVDELERSERINEIPAQPRFWLVVTTSFGVLFAAEWGDLSQILTAGLAARTASPISVFLGSWVALITVAALACLLGGFLRDRFPIWRIKLVSAVILTGLAVWTLIEFINA
jgi:putative Ca2+/H+ antiporter (TMEM165/GDT1 family)